MVLSSFRVASVVSLFLTCVYGQEVCPGSTSGNCVYNNVALASATNSKANGHYYIAGLFGVHDKATNAYSCADAPIRDRGILNVEAFHWAIRKYSAPTSSDVSVGGVALDSCSRSEATLENILSFETCKVQFGTTNRPSPRSVLAYVGPDRSSEAMASAMLLNDMNKTQVSHAATSPDLKDRVKYPYFLRSVPSDDYDATIMVQILKKMNVKYVVVANLGNTYGRGGYTSLKTKLAAEGICIVTHQEIPVDATASQLTTIADSIVDARASRFVIVFADAAYSKQLLNAVQARSLVDFQNMVFIGTSSWAASTDVVENLQINAYTVALGQPASLSADVNEFYTYLDNLKVNDATVYNPWFETYWRTKLECGTNACDLNTATLKDKYSRDVYVPYTLMAVKAIVDGVNSAATAACQKYDLCSQLLNQDNRGQKIYEGIRNTIFTTDGEVKDDYVLYNVMQYDPVKKYQKVATYSPASGLTITQVFPSLSSECPNSPCRECGENPTTEPPTTAATTKKVETTTKDPLEDGKYKFIKFLTDQHFTGVYVDQSRSQFGTRFDIGEKWIIALGVLSGLGMLAVIVFEIYIMFKLLDSKIGHQWRTMWLGQLLLFGIFLAYLTLLAFLWIPSKATCGITRFGVGVSYAMIYAVLLVKLMVILTSKTSESIMPGDIESPNYLKGIYQFLMYIFAVGIQVVIEVQWMIQVPPEAVMVKDNAGKDAWICNHYTWSAENGWMNMKMFVRSEFENHLLSLVYVMALILITTIVAMRSHGIITNHRESVFIGIAAGFSIPIWIAWTLVGGLNGDGVNGHQYGDASIAFGLFTCATLALFAMFLPKVRQLVNMGVEGIYLEDDHDTMYAGSVIMPPPSYKSRPSSVVYANATGVYSDPILLGSTINGDAHSLHLKHPGISHLGQTSVYSAPVYMKKGESSKVLKVTGDLRGKHPPAKPASEAGDVAESYYTARKTKSEMGTLRRGRSNSNTSLGAL